MWREGGQFSTDKYLSKITKKNWKLFFKQIEFFFL
jgi:hypothetical protein